MSLDGYLATKDDDLSWLSMVEQEGEDYGYTEFTSKVGSYLIGRKTYEVVLKLTGGDFPQAQQFDCYVITRENRVDENGIRFYNGKLEELIDRLKKENKGHIYCDGGGQLVRALLEKDLIDEYIISVIPILLGEGKRLFPGNSGQIPLTLISSKQFESGLTQLRYERK